MLGVFAGFAHLVPGFFIVVSGLVAPLWAVALMTAVWLLMAWGLVALVLRRSWWTPVVPVLAMLFWFGTINAGGALLGWTA